MTLAGIKVSLALGVRVKEMVAVLANLLNIFLTVAMGTRLQVTRALVKDVPLQMQGATLDWQFCAVAAVKPSITRKVNTLNMFCNYFKCANSNIYSRSIKVTLPKFWRGIIVCWFSSLKCALTSMKESSFLFLRVALRPWLLYNEKVVLSNALAFAIGWKISKMVALICLRLVQHISICCNCFSKLHIHEILS